MLNPYVQTFVEVAERGSFSAAAERLHISKVSVMNQVNALEARVGVPLFERTHQGVRLTGAGESFYKNAVKLLRLSQSAIAEARQTGGAAAQTIRIGTSLMRPCNSLVALWERIDAGNRDVQFSIVPFNDGFDSLNAMLAALGEKIDCFVTPCSSARMLAKYSFLPLRACECRIAMSKKHPLAGKDVLTWDDLDRQSLLLVRRGDSYVLDALRDDILRDHPGIRIVDFDGYYDVSAFNLCEQQGYLMETLDIWAGLHPSLVTLPVKWDYQMPYGILYAKKPTKPVQAFIEAIATSVNPSL